jgi:quercetin dioxygenase-like cupin family protein
MLPPAEALLLESLITPTDQGIASRVLARSAAGNVTLFAFDAGQGLTEHTTAFDALLLVLDGALTLTIGGAAVDAPAGSVTRLPHAVEAVERSRMLLIMLRETQA